MIDIFKDPVVERIAGTEVKFFVNGTPPAPKANFIYQNDNIVSMSTMAMANRMAQDIVKSHVLTDGPAVLMSSGDNGPLPVGNFILWGCQVFEKTEAKYEIRALTGPISYENMGLPSGFMFDSRILFPWCMRHKREDAQFQVGMIPGKGDMRFVQLANELELKGIRVISPEAHLRTQLGIIAASKLVVTSSISAYIMADSFNVPVYMFHTGDNYGELRVKLEDYFAGLERKCPDMLDFGSHISISSYPDTQAVSKDYLLEKVKKYVELCPFETRKELFDEIKGYFDEV